MKKYLRRSAMLLTLMSVSMAASAQYQCRSGNTYYQSSRPCVAAAPPTLAAPAPAAAAPGFGQITPRPEIRGYEPPVRRVTITPAAEHLRYMSARCVEIAEAIRTGPSRGVRYDVIADLHREHHAKCSEEEREARQQLSEQQRGERDQRTAVRRAERSERDSAVRHTEQCSESLRILHTKRQRMATMTDGEKADLARFEDAYQARCKG